MPAVHLESVRGELEPGGYGVLRESEGPALGVCESLTLVVAFEREAR